MIGIRHYKFRGYSKQPGSDMKKTLILFLALLSFSLSAAADMNIFKDGVRVEAPCVWEENEEVCCEIGGIVFSK